MKFSIRVTLIVFLIFIFFNSCASTKKNTGENLIEDKKNEDMAGNVSDTEAPKDSENLKNSEKIIIMKIPENSQQGQGILPKKNTDSLLNNNDLQLKPKADSAESVSDPKPITDKPALELILDGEDENEPVPLAEKPEVKKTETSVPPAPDKPLISVPDKKQVVKPAEAPNKTTKPEIKEKTLEKSGTGSDTAPLVTKTEPPAAKVESAAAEVKPPVSEASGVNDKDIVNEKMKELEPDRVFSEFPSTEPDDSKEQKASRSVKLYEGQRLEVVYPGEGWVYLGESSAQKGIRYQQRKLQNGTSIFHFGMANEGSYILNFSHFDVFSDNFISDSVAVHVEKAKTKLNDTVKAPDYKGTVSRTENKPDLKKENRYGDKAGTPLKPDSSSKKDENAKVYDSPDLVTVTEKEESKTDGQKITSPSEFLDMIRGYISEGNSAEALNSADSFLKNYSENLDEALFLRGQAYELNGPNKNVKKALEAYQTLTKAYPESKFWDKADARIRYIKKFYIDIK
ncbi:outer membrane protein assembly factor BamD [Treponema sp. OMZ 792]|uniref:outer membrane protein assembly factor BamD n=1 Tax=unclassified Treponema TaxID=2638727 RepID=UPI0020A49383|nr:MULTISPECIES: outer membrane protein assembly factor BamD [unclassified Treponema]UTC76222.1 outer membrane protein assembly factor BamD [Treponema sp. OMZ 792]UTC80223.1 outer membrane protein assembly factor BamD [Treponema sp. OMZ 798]